MYTYIYIYTCIYVQYHYISPIEFQIDITIVFPCVPGALEAKLSKESKRRALSFMEQLQGSHGFKDGDVFHGKIGEQWGKNVESTGWVGWVKT